MSNKIRIIRPIWQDCFFMVVRTYFLLWRFIVQHKLLFMIFVMKYESLLGETIPIKWIYIFFSSNALLSWITVVLNEQYINCIPHYSQPWECVAGCSSKIVDNAIDVRCSKSHFIWKLVASQNAKKLKKPEIPSFFLRKFLMDSLP